MLMDSCLDVFERLVSKTYCKQFRVGSLKAAVSCVSIVSVEENNTNSKPDARGF